MKKNHSEFLERQQEIRQKIKRWYEKTIGMPPREITIEFLEKQVVILVENSPSPLQKLLKGNFSEEFRWLFQRGFSQIVKSQIQLIIEEVFYEVEALEIFSEGSVETDGLGIIVVLDRPPNFFKSELIEKAIAKSKTQKIKLLTPLSPRELEVLHLIVEGYSNSEIASEMFISPGTVKTHVRNLIGKLGVNDRTQAAGNRIAIGVG